MSPDRLTAILDVVQAAAALKDTRRSGRTARGRRESTADHSWRLCLLVCLCERDLGGVDLLRLFKLCVIHDLGEAISGDIPAPHQRTGDGRAARERADMARLVAPLPEPQRAEIMALWDDYAAGASREAALAKGFDKIETMLQHLQAPCGIDLAFNLTYGRRWTDRHPLLAALRARVDTATRGRLAARGAWRRRLTAPWRPVAAEDPAAWGRDPLSHPDLRRMTPRELSDLPFDPARVDRD